MDSESRQFSKPTKGQIAATIGLLAFASIIEGVSDYVNEMFLTRPNLTLPEILFTTIFFFILILVVLVPVFWFCWNRIVAPVFRLPSMSYTHCLIVVTLALVFIGD